MDKKFNQEFNQEFISTLQEANRQATELYYYLADQLDSLDTDEWGADVKDKLADLNSLVIMSWALVSTIMDMVAEHTNPEIRLTFNSESELKETFEAIYKNSGRISVDEAKARAQNILLQAMLNLDPEYYTPFYVKIAQNWEVAISPDEENEKLLCYIFPVENGKAVLHSTPIPVEFVL